MHKAAMQKEKNGWYLIGKYRQYSTSYIYRHGI